MPAAAQSWRRCWSAISLHRRNEAIALARNRLDKPRIVCRIPQGQPDLLDGRVETLIKFDESIRRPKRFLQILAAHQLTRAADQQYENLKRLVLQLDSWSCLRNSPAEESSSNSPKRITRGAVGCEDMYKDCRVEQIIHPTGIEPVYPGE